MAPVLSTLELPLPPSAPALVAWAGALVVLLEEVLAVWEVEDEVEDDDVLDVLELLVEDDLELVELLLETEDVGVEVDAELDVDGVNVPVLVLIVVGVASVLGDSVRLTWTLVRETASVRPDADASTVVPRALAVPHPYWDWPPPKTFL